MIFHYSDRLLSVRSSVSKLFTFSSPPKPLFWTNLSTRHSLVKGSKVYSSGGLHSFPMGDICNNERAKIQRRNFKVFLFSRTSWPISTILHAKYHWVRMIQDYSYERVRPFQRRGDKNKLAKIRRQNLKIFVSRTTELFQPNLVQSILG